MLDTFSAQIPQLVILWSLWPLKTLGLYNFATPWPSRTKSTPFERSNLYSLGKSEKKMFRSTFDAIYARSKKP